MFLSVDLVKNSFPNVSLLKIIHLKFVYKPIPTISPKPEDFLINLSLYLVQNKIPERVLKININKRVK